MTSSKGKSKHRYKLYFMPEALDEWKNLDGSVRANLKKLLEKRLDNPHVPGGELHGALTRCYKIKLSQQGVRLVYSVEEDHLLVTVIAVDKREDSAVYKSAVARISAAAAIANALRGKKQEVGSRLKSRWPINGRRGPTA